MKIAVIQHALRPAPAGDLEALVYASARAAADGASLVVIPNVSAVHDGPLGPDLFRRVEEAAPGLAVLVAHEESRDAGASSVLEVPELGRTVLLMGDECCDGDVLAAIAAEAPGVAVLAPGAESELQAQAVMELAIGLSTSLASLVIVAEADGATAGEPGHGGSAIIHLGQILGEGMAGDDIVTADLATPLGPPEAPTSLPEVPLLLMQRLAAHQGRKLDVGYPADLG